MIEIVLINALVISLVVSIHYEVLKFVSELMPRLTIAKRMRVVVGIIGALLAHIAEILVFGCVYFIVLHQTNLGSLIAIDTTFTDTLLDCTYFSFATYTSLGFGDVVAVGPLRFVAGVESLVGLVMIGWTASFVYVEMTRFWGKV